MQELSNNIDKIVDEKMLMGAEKVLQETAKKWASYSLDNFKDELLTKALKISGAIAIFVDEWECCSDESKRM